METTATVAIIGMIASITGPVVLKKTTEARVDTTQQEMIQLKEAIEEYTIDHFGTAPTGADFSAVVTTLNTAGYLETLFSASADPEGVTNWSKDGWDVNYVYSPATDSAAGSLTSYGPDKASGGSDDITLVLPKTGS